MFLYLPYLAVHTGGFKNPMQAPAEEIAKFSYIDDLNRRIYAAMTSLLDNSVIKVISALREKQMLENSVVLFMSDNGVPTVGCIHSNYGSNYPLKGLNCSPWQGGSRCVAAIWSPLIKKPQRVSNRLMHITDWLPTFYSLIGLNSNELENTDGFDMGSSISEGSESLRTEFVYNIDEVFNYTTIRKGDWKYVHGTVKETQDSWYGASNRDKNYYYDQNMVLKSEAGLVFAEFQSLNNLTMAEMRMSATIKCSESNHSNLSERSKCNPLEAPCLFKSKEDPCELVNLAKDKPDIMTYLEDMHLNIMNTVVPFDPAANPIYWNNTWVSWRDHIDIQKYKCFKKN